MTLRTLRASPARRQILLDQQYGPALWRAPEPPHVRPGLQRLPRMALVAVCLDGGVLLFSLALLIFALRRLAS